MIDGLRLTMSGEDLRQLLDERIESHRRRAAWWKHEQTRTPEEQTEECPLLPDQICENEAERHEWRADVLLFIRNRIEPTASYRLGEQDLEFGELLPAKPGWLEQEEFEERNRIGFELQQLTKRVSEALPSIWAARMPDLGEDESTIGGRDSG